MFSVLLIEDIKNVHVKCIGSIFMPSTSLAQSMVDLHAWVAFSFFWYSHRRARLEICGRHSLENQSAPGAVLEIAEADKNSMEFMYNIEAYKEHL